VDARPGHDAHRLLRLPRHHKAAEHVQSASTQVHPSPTKLEATKPIGRTQVVGDIFGNLKNNNPYA
jgi:hypothetical protein